MNLPLRKKSCPTCPFSPGSPYAYLAGDLAVKAMTEATRICHSTGSGNAINRRTGKPPAICRGARDVQLRYMAACGVISEATDEAWDKARARIGLGKTEVVE